MGIRGRTCDPADENKTFSFLSRQYLSYENPGYYYHDGRSGFFRRRYGKSEYEQVKTAIEAVANGLSLRKAAKLFSISKSVLHRYSKQGIPFLMEKCAQSQF
ncbi:uncharacterized protein LOC143149475 [Ptiloglossa arizonensis]|uniref:uncharacterized protein LOC143149475 n=1 Tax=Ptiloglossa arizonensis TaxID=3350558 RepID=UPI003F9FABCA